VTRNLARAVVPLTSTVATREWTNNGLLDLIYRKTTGAVVLCMLVVISLGNIADRDGDTKRLADSRGFLGP
jgi:ABC-type uncharacterized transport system YnjBCD permease subunit